MIFWGCFFGDFGVFFGDLWRFFAIFFVIFGVFGTVGAHLEPKWAQGAKKEQKGVGGHPSCCVFTTPVQRIALSKSEPGKSR